jgi:redox-sensitive bicupin YhaK (pirin superfamily)
MRDLFPKQDQLQATMFGGRFHANKPVVGGRDPRGAAASALFYWSHAYATGACEFGLHPHEGFEIMTFVLAGENAHYDTATAKWTPLVKGDFQVIRSGSGLSHAERIAEGTRAFQIWFDPDLKQSLREPPGYEDHSPRDVPSVAKGDVTTTEYVGGRSGVRAATEGLSIRKIAFASAGAYTLRLAAGQRYSVYVLAGSCRLGGKAAATDDMMNAAGGDLRIEHEAGCELFVIELPLAPSYAPVAR